MVHVHGAQMQQLVAQTRGLAPERLVAVPIDIGKGSAAALVCDFTGELLAGRFRATSLLVCQIERRLAGVSSPSSRSVSGTAVPMLSRDPA